MKVKPLSFHISSKTQRLNTLMDLIGKFVNIASRLASFITKKFAGRLANRLPDQDLFNAFVAKKIEISEAYEALNFAKAMREIIQLADLA